VLAPITGTVRKVRANPVVNVPGTMGKPPAGILVLESTDGAMVMVAHLGSFTVEEGATVEAGQPIGTVGNNGMSRHPHIHLGAWRGETPLQLRVDQATIQPARAADGSPMK